MVKPESPPILRKSGAEKLRFACRTTRIRTEPQIHNISYLLLFHDNSGYANAPQCYAIRTLPIVLHLQNMLKNHRLSSFDTCEQIDQRIRGNQK